MSKSICFGTPLPCYHLFLMIITHLHSLISTSVLMILSSLCPLPVHCCYSVVLCHLFVVVSLSASLSVSQPVLPLLLLSLFLLVPIRIELFLLQSCLLFSLDEATYYYHRMSLPPPPLVLRFGPFPPCCYDES